MEECESLDSEMTELQEFQSEANSQDDEDEVEELQNSLREVVQDQSVRPKLQCLMVDPSFSMVTVQSEDSGIVWETASSRCSTPWASETSSTSEAYSMEGSGAAGKITIVFDEEKIVRRRTRSGGRSRLGDRLSRPGSSRSASALGVERPEMAEVSLPNVKQEKPPTEPNLEEIKKRDQQLFSLISDGYEILNIRVPSKLPTVDEEESTELQDNLSYLDQTPKIRSKNHHDWTQIQNHVLPEDGEIQDHKEPTKQDTSQSPTDTELSKTPTSKESTGDIDYFEKFTLLDAVVSEDQPPEIQKEAEQPAGKSQEEEPKPDKEIATDRPSASEDSFIIVTDVEIVGEHLDEVFYGEGAPPEAVRGRDDEEAEGGGGMRRRRESQRSRKESGSVLFGSQETILTPIFISAGPPKIIDQILLDEPTAMSFMYSDLYEDAVGERRKSDEEYSEAESIATEKSYKRRLSDSEETDGYLEKFTLKDQTPIVEDQPESVEDKREGRRMWSQNMFEMTGCLTRVVQKEDVDKSKTEEPETQEVIVGEKGEDLQLEAKEQKREIFTETAKVERETIILTDEEPVKESVQESKPTEDQIKVQEVEHDHTEPPESSTDEPLPGAQQVDSKVEKTEERDEHLREVTDETTSEPVIETELQAQEVAEKVAEVDLNASEETATVHTEFPHTITESIIPTESTEKSLSEEAATDSEMVATEEKVVTEAESEIQENFTPTEIDTSAETSMLQEKDTAEDVAPVEVTTDCDSSMHATVEVIEKEVAEKEIQTQVQIDLQEVKSVETTEVQTEVAGEEEQEAEIKEAAVDRKVSGVITEAEQESEAKTEISSEPGEIKTHSDKKQEEICESEQHQQEEKPVTDSESDKTELIIEAKEERPKEDTGTVQEMVNDGDGLIVLVPKGQAVEMDIEISQSEKTIGNTAVLSEPGSTCEQLTAAESITVSPEIIQATPEETMTESQQGVKPEAVLKDEVLPGNEFDDSYSPPEPVEEAEPEEQKIELDFEEDEGVFSPLRSFTPQEDLSGLHREDPQSEQPEVGQNEDIHKVEDVPETNIVIEDSSLEIDLQREEEGQKVEQDEAVIVEAPEVTVEEFEYEMISEQDAKDMPQPETQRDVEEPKSESGQEREERLDVQMEVEMEKKEEVFDLSPEEELIEADYDIIDAEEESQARLAAELQGMDWFCLTCGCLLSEDGCSSGEHYNHKVTAVDQAYEEIKEKLGDWISELQGRSENIEDLVSELELGYNSVEDQCVECEAAMQVQNDEMMALVMEQYNNMSVSMEEEKKAKLEQLYDQIVSFQESIDSAKATLDTTTREAETDARSPEDIHLRLKAALDSAMSLELGPRGLLVFEDYAKGNTSSSNLAQRKGIPVPQRPTLQPQEAGSASSTSVTVYWKVNAGDIIDCFQVYCMEDPQGAVSEEYRVTVKESYCVLEELEPDKSYKVWVMAVNYTGCSLPSERLTFRTAPSVPVIDTERCTVLWDSATLRWSSTQQTTEQSFTLEYCRQYELEGEGLRTIAGIQSCEQRVLLQPNENYLFYIKAVNEAGASEQSEAALISTKGTKFCLLKSTAHPALELSVDKTTVHLSQGTPEDTPSSDKLCPSILGELLPCKGQYYWETVASGSTAYRLGVVYSSANRNSLLGENSLSWCLQCIPTPSGCRYQLLHNDAQSSVFVNYIPERVGTLLDFKRGRLSFYNARTGQLLGAFCQHFNQPCHPALALEMPGRLEVSMVPEVPEFTNDS
ncbi:cardiomyopathy-associated protein 5 [Tautogolabrus adspersus]